MVGSKDRIEYLDWLRALAAAFVMFGHSNNPIAPGGAVGVSVFFVLSGYLITSILLRDGMMTVENIVKFISRRWARIYPMYVIQISLIWIMIATLQPDKLNVFITGLRGLLVFWSEPPWVGYGVGVLWTLAIEFWFYVTFPFILWGFVLSGRPILCIFVGIAVSVAAKVLGLGGVTLHYYDHFLLGSLCAASIKYNRIPSFAYWPKLFAAGVAAILLIAATPYPGTRGLLWHCQSLSTAAATAFVIISGHVNRPSISMPVVAFLGRISYSIYLMHAVVLDAFIINFDISRYLWAYVALVLAVSTLTYYTIEAPSERQARRTVRYRLT